VRTYQNVPTDFHGRDETELAADRGERFRGVAAFLSRVMTRVSIDMPGGAPSNLALEAVDLCDVRMIERGEDLGLTAEPSDAFGIVGERGWQDLQRDITTKLGVLGAVDLAHPTGARWRRESRRRRGGCQWKTARLT